MLFDDRRDAGRRLGQNLAAYAGRDDVIVLALPRGGVPVGYEVARALGAPLDVFIVRKLGTPGQSELAMGAIASGGIVVVNRDVVDMLRIPDSAVDAAVAREGEELSRRERLYRAGREELVLAGRVVLLVDDGLATGSTMRAAAQAISTRDPQRVVVAVPVAAPSACELLAREADEVVCLATPELFSAVGQWYDDFAQTSDDEVRLLLERAERERASAEGRGL